MSDIIEGLKQKRKKIEQFRQDKSRQEGQRAQMLTQLESEHGVNSVVEAENKIEKLTQEHVEHVEILRELDAEMGEIIHNATPGSDSGTV